MNLVMMTMVESIVKDGLKRMQELISMKLRSRRKSSRERKLARVGGGGVVFSTVGSRQEMLIRYTILGFLNSM